MRKKNFKDKKLREELWEKTGWGKVASWYQNTINVGKSTQKDIILPELLKFFPITEVKGKAIIDLGCGTGFFIKEYLRGGALKSLGVDLDREMLELANQNLREEVESDRVVFMEGDASEVDSVGDSSFQVAMSIESIQNIKDLKSFVKGVSRILEKGGVFIVVMNHPAFRVPKSADWHYDLENHRQGRVVYRYLTKHTVNIDMNPGEKNKNKKVYTYSFHRPMEEYLNVFSEAGLMVERNKEVISNKLSQSGKRKKEEDEARKEIPMFWFLKLRKI